MTHTQDIPDPKDPVYIGETALYVADTWNYLESITLISTLPALISSPCIIFAFGYLFIQTSDISYLE